MNTEQRILFLFMLMLTLAVLQTIASASSVGEPDSSNAEIVDRVVAVVNNEIITLSDLNARLKPYAQRIGTSGYTPDNERRLIYQVREDILQKLIDQKLTDQEIKRYRIQVGENEIDQTIERIKQSKFLTEEEFREALRIDGLTLAKYREQLKEQLQRRKLLNFEISSKIVITKEDVLDYYQAHPEKYGIKKKYHLKSIVLRIPALADDQEKAAYLQTMQTIRGAIVAGHPFETAAEKLAAPGVPVRTADLGAIETGSLSPQLKDALATLSAGDITDVLNTDQGYQILLLSRTENAAGRSLEEVTPEIEDLLYNQIVDKNFQQWLKELRERSHIKIIR